MLKLRVLSFYFNQQIRLIKGDMPYTSVILYYSLRCFCKICLFIKRLCSFFSHAILALIRQADFADFVPLNIMYVALL